MKKIFLLLLLHSFPIFPQSDLDKVVKGGELLLSGLSILKAARSDAKKDSKTVESVCVKNKLSQKITFRISRTDKEDNIFQKEVVVQKDGKECLFELPKGIYSYEILFASNEVYKKGEYKFEDIITFTVKDP